MLTIYIRQFLPDGTKKHYRASVSHRWAVKHDNGALISCGLQVGGEDESLPEANLRGLIRNGQAKEVSEERWQHSGCQSACKLRGDKECRW